MMRTGWKSVALGRESGLRNQFACVFYHALKPDRKHATALMITVRGETAGLSLACLHRKQLPNVALRPVAPLFSRFEYPRAAAALMG
jgi:hypothetical protein